MKARIALPDRAALTPAGQAVYDSILKSRGAIDGPFLAWLHAPALADPAETLGAHCRFGTSLTRQEAELLILTAAAHFACNAEWTLHAPIALQSGLPADVVEAIRAGDPPPFTDGRPAVLHHFAQSLLAHNRIDAPTFEAAAAEFGVPALVEAVGVLGYYALVAFTLNAFDMRVDGAAPIFG